MGQLFLHHVSAINTKHCLLVLWPICYHCYCLGCTSAVLCALLWALSMLLTLLEWSGNRQTFQAVPQRAQQDTPGVDECGESYHWGTKETSRSRLEQ
ncbi:mas-related G-protein coupled receptor member X3-like [Peromyscus leucopus]|uniref:mas-related G-protein coupled receptor member X3-like n=1 Tax=Peromyscus leucopus TaxID=10041 RepID=UPI0010A1727E|nr:mas-related G-protein coupled receptor member X3-like [Peromyscus leucopus]